MEVERLEATLSVGGLGGFQTAMAAADRLTGNTRGQLDKLAAISKVATDALQRVKMTAGQTAETSAAAEAMKRSVSSITSTARDAADHLDRVKLDASKAAETRVSADIEAESLKKIGRQAEETTAKLEVMNRTGRNGVGVGPIGSGFGRIGVLGSAIGAAVLTVPAAAPALMGILAAIPVLAATGAGALGTLALAFGGVFKAIGGDKKAFDDLNSSQQSFVMTIRSLDGWLDKLKQTAASSMFPGLTAGLKAALSPGTLGAITQAVSEFGHAIGTAGEAWGKYFGSTEFQSIFGPLMEAGAKNLGLLSSAALSLFDALGVLGRAAIPFTSWMTQGVASGAKLADSWLHAKDASGALSGAMSEAEVSLRLVGNLFGALLSAAGALGAALYPVSKVAVKDLTDGLNALANIIRDNQQAIRNVVSGALGAFVSTVRTASVVVGALWPVLQKAVGFLGGWKTAFELLIGLKMASVFNGWAVAIMKLAGADALGAAETKSAGLLTNLGKLKLLGPIAVAFTVTEVVNKITGSSGLDMSNSITPDVVRAGNPYPVGTEVNNAYAAGLAGKAPTQRTTGSSAVKAAFDAGVKAAAKSTAAAGTGGGGSYMAQVAAMLGIPATPANLSFLDAWASREGIPQNIDPNNMLGTTLPMSNSYGTNSAGVQAYPSRAAGVKATAAMLSQGNFAPILAALKSGNAYKSANDPAVQKAFLAWSGGGYSFPTSSSSGPYSTPEPYAPTTKPPKPPVIPAHVTNALNMAKTNAANAKSLGNAGGTATRYLNSELADLTTAQTELQAQVGKASGKAKTQLQTALTNVGTKIIAVQTLIKNAVLVTGDALLPASLKTKLASLTSRFAADSAYATSLTGQAAENYASVLKSDLLGQESVLTQQVASLKSKLGGATGKQKTAIQAEITKVTSQLQSVQGQVLQSLQQTVSTLQGKVSTAFSSVLSEIDASFDAQTQGMISKVANATFQNGLQTPLEAQLAAMQAQDQLQGYLDAVTQAQSAGDPVALAAAKRQLDEYNLSIQAAAERTAADQSYAAQIAQIQQDRAKAESAMNTQLQGLADKLQNGTGSVKDLAAIASEWGVKIDTTSIPDLDTLSAASSGLLQAFKDLADYIAKMTGTSPKIPAGLGSGSGAPAPATGGTAPGQIIGGFTQAGIQAGFGGIGTPAGDANLQAIINANLHAAGVPGYSEGGPTGAGGLSMLHDDEYVVPKKGALVLSGGSRGADQPQQIVIPITLELDGKVITEVVYKQLLRKANRNGLSLPTGQKGRLGLS